MKPVASGNGRSGFGVYRSRTTKEEVELLVNVRVSDRKAIVAAVISVTYKLR